MNTEEKNQLVLGIARDLGEKFGCEQDVQDACADLILGLRISEIVMAFSEGLRISLPITGKVVERGAVQEMPDVQGDEGEALQ